MSQIKIKLQNLIKPYGKKIMEMILLTSISSINTVLSN